MNPMFARTRGERSTEHPAHVRDLFSYPDPTRPDPLTTSLRSVVPSVDLSLPACRSVPRKRAPSPTPPARRWLASSRLAGRP